MYAVQLSPNWTYEEQEAYYESLAKEIKGKKIGIRELDAGLAARIAPHLQYLKLEGRFNSHFDPKFVVELLTQCKKLRELKVLNCPIAHLPLEPLTHLKKLEIKNCDALSVPWRVALLVALFKNSPKRIHRIAQTIEMEAYLPVLQLEKRAQYHLLQNLEKLEQSSLIRHFCYLFPISMNTFNLLAGEQLFTGKRIEDKILIKLLFAITFQSPVQIEGKLRESLIHFLQTKTGKALTEMHLEFFFNHALWMKSLLQARPPCNKENLPIYLQSKANKTKLYLNLWQKIPLYHPKTILKKLGNCRHIDIHYFANKGIDEGALGKDFIVQLLQGILKGHPHLHFDKNHSGKFHLRPQNPLNTHYNELKAAVALGHLFGLAIKHGYPVGALFSKNWLRCIHSIPYEFLEESSFYVEAYLMELSIASLEKKLDLPNTPHMLECLQHIKAIFDSEDPIEISRSATWLNQRWEDDAITQAITSQNIPQMRQEVKRAWVSSYKGYTTLAFCVAKGLNTMLPLRIDGLQVKSWKQLQMISTQKFSVVLQGKQTISQIKKLLRGPVDILSWLHAWIDAHAKEPEALANVIQAFTGARSLIDKIKFARCNSIPDIVIETCFQIVYVSNKIDETGFNFLLDHFANEYVAEFPMY